MHCAFQLNMPRRYAEIYDGVLYYDGVPLGTCQFNVPEDELIDFDGEFWCPFHLPVKDREGQSSVKTQWTADKNSFFEMQLLSLILEAINQPRALNFSGVVFPSNLTFLNIAKESLSFSDDVLFCNSKFLGREYFDKFSFKQDVCFDDAVFSGLASFRDTRFSKDASFNNVRFESVAIFQSASVFENIHFKNTTFCDLATFRNLVFNNKAFFSGTIFEGNADFSGSEIFHEIDFSKSHFRANVCFTNRQFQGKTSFRETVFGVAPEFYSATLHQDTNFTDAKFEDTESEGAARAYRSLKVAMETVRARNEEAMFYALEQKSLRKRHDTPLVVKLFSLLYEITSDYGRSLLRPLLWFAVFFFASNFAYAHIAVLYGPPMPVDALSLAVEQIIRPFSIWTADYSGRAWIETALVERPVLLRFIASVQSILCLSFLALFLLALRWRFKRG